MSVIDEIVAANRRFSERFTGPPEGRPARRLAVVACMDCRLDLLAGLGLEIGDAHFLRNAGGLPTDDVLRSLAISQRALGTTAIAVLHHTRCGMEGFDDEAFRGELAAETGRAPGWRVEGFSDVQDEVRRSLRTIRECPWLPHRDDVRGFVYDVDRAALHEVEG